MVDANTSQSLYLQAMKESKLDHYIILHPSCQITHSLSLSCISAPFVNCLNQLTIMECILYKDGKLNEASTWHFGQATCTKSICLHLLYSKGNMVVTRQFSQRDVKLHSSTTSILSFSIKRDSKMYSQHPLGL